MSGLILAGIGKGIADAGAAYGAGMARAAEFEYKAQEDERAMKRKLEFEDQRAETLKQRVIREIEEVNKASGDIAAKRDAAQFDKDTGKIAGVAERVAGASPAMSQDEIGQLIKDNPQYRETYRKAGLIDKAMTPDQQRIQAAEDKVQGALGIGAHSTVIDAFQKSKDSVLKEIREDNKEANQKRERDQADRRLDLMEERITSQNKTDNIRANKPAGGGAGGAAKVRSTYTDDQGQKVAVMSDGSTQVLGKAADYNKSIASLIAQREKNDYQFSKLPEADKKSWATDRLAGGNSGVPTKPSDNSATRPALDSFRR